MQGILSSLRSALELICLCCVLFFIVTPVSTQQALETEAAFSLVQEQTLSISVTVLFEEKTVVMDLEKYITGVVLAEMPASFETEALKAQAIAARTYAWKLSTTAAKHPQGAVCTDPTCCQGYISLEEYLQKTHSAKNIIRVQEAVRNTAGIILTFQGEPIEATFFSCSGGFTEDAEAVWGREYPYLTAKESPGEETAFCFKSTKTISRAELEDTLHVLLGSDPNTWFQDWIYTDSGGVYSVCVGDRLFSGTELRRKLDLNSTMFSVETQDDAVTFLVRGYGHRVGLSQYGANALAEKGMSCAAILHYYYDGVELQIIGSF